LLDPTRLTLHTQFQVGPVDPRLFGGFLEHMGRAVYEGVYEPASAQADEYGFRRDVLAALKRLGMTTLRYPGGNFASGYHWMDGIGPQAGRPTTLNLAWHSLELNHFGTGEFMQLCRLLGSSPMLTVNLGTGTPEEARNWIEYCNVEAETQYALRRSQNGREEPYGVKLWCLGNEMDGPWQLGHVPAAEYALRAQQAAKMMKDVDRSIELIACGSSGIGLPTYLEWDRTVLEVLGDEADYLSLHRYVGNPSGDTLDYLAVTNSIDRQIEEMDSVCRFVQAKHRSKKRAYLSFDEWNVWYKNMQMDGSNQSAPHLIEEVYNLEDALVVAGFLHSFIRHADVLKIANLAQLVNVIAPLQTRHDELLIQSTFYPFEMVSNRRGDPLGRPGISLRPAVWGPVYEGRTNGLVPYIDSSAILADDRLHVFVTNRHPSESAPLEILLADRPITALESAELLTGPDAKAANSFEQPDLIVSHSFEAARVRQGRVALELPPLSFLATTWRL